MSSGHAWKEPDLSTCDLCGDKDWMADKYCSENPEVAKEYEEWREALKAMDAMTQIAEICGDYD